MKKLNINFLKINILFKGIKYDKSYKENQKRDFPGGPVGKTPHLQCRVPRFDPWLGN